MLKNISWTSYSIFVLVVLIGYYLTICITYYKQEIANIISGKSNVFAKIKQGSQQASATRNKSVLYDEQSDETNLLSLTNQFAYEIKIALSQAANNHHIKEEVIYSLQQLAKKYSQLKASPFQSFINNYILVENSNYSSIHLSEEDLNTLWVM